MKGKTKQMAEGSKLVASNYRTWIKSISNLNIKKIMLNIVNGLKTKVLIQPHNINEIKFKFKNHRCNAI